MSGPHKLRHLNIKSCLYSLFCVEIRSVLNKTCVIEVHIIHNKHWNSSNGSYGKLFSPHQVDICLLWYILTRFIQFVVCIQDSVSSHTTRDMSAVVIVTRFIQFVVCIQDSVSTHTIRDKNHMSDSHDKAGFYI